MKILNLFLVTLLLASSAACKKEKSPQLQILVLTDNGPASDFVLNISPISGKTISATTDKDGKATISLEINTEYYIIQGLNFSDLSSFYIGNPEATYVYKGTFTSQQEINNSAQQTPAAAIGGPKYLDINGDGIIDKYDKAIQLTTSVEKEQELVIYLKK